MRSTAEQCKILRVSVRLFRAEGEVAGCVYSLEWSEGEGEGGGGQVAAAQTCLIHILRDLQIMGTTVNRYTLCSKAIVLFKIDTLRNYLRRKTRILGIWNMA